MYVSAQQRELRLTPIPDKFTKEGGYIGRIRGRKTLSYGEVLDEIVGNRILNLDKQTLHLILTHTFETMINNTLKDGNSRKISNYFTLQVEIRGRFEEPGDQFDPKEQSFRLVLRPLSGIRNRKPNHDDGLTVYNRNAGPKVTINRLYSASAPEKNGLVFGDDLIIEGENLFMLKDSNHTDCLRVKYFTQRQHGVYTAFSRSAYGPIIPFAYDDDWFTVSDDGRQIRIPWQRAVGNYIEKWDPTNFNPETNVPLALMIGVRSRGGAPKSKRQLHRARAYFDSWLASHPNTTIKSTIWGRA